MHLIPAAWQTIYNNELVWYWYSPNASSIIAVSCDRLQFVASIPIDFLTITALIL
jgi:hypothetical protein